MTIDELAVMIANGFTELESSLISRMDERFENVDQRFDVLEQKMDNGFREVHQRIDLVAALHEEHSQRLKNLELRAA